VADETLTSSEVNGAAACVSRPRPRLRWDHPGDHLRCGTLTASSYGRTRLRWPSMYAVVASMMAIMVLGGSPKSADLVVVTRTGTTTVALETSRATLRCRAHSAKATGFLRTRPDASCAVVRSGLERIIQVRSEGMRLCSQIYGGPQHAEITGRLGSESIDIVIARSDGCGIADWRTLQPLLGNPKRR
jgi:hypothetical protein